MFGGGGVGGKLELLVAEGFDLDGGRDEGICVELFGDGVDDIVV